MLTKTTQGIHNEIPNYNRFEGCEICNSFLDNIPPPLSLVNSWKFVTIATKK